MILYVNEKNEVHDVKTTSDPALTALTVNDTDNPFASWSTAKICCYRVEVKNGEITMYTPYVDSRLIEHIDQLGKQTEAITPWTASKTAYIDDTSVSFENVPQGNMSVYVGGVNHTLFERDGDRVVVRFEALTESKEVTISII